jgi:heme exporter protein B
MLSSFRLILWHDMKATFNQTFAWLTPLFFFVLVVSLFPLSMEQDPALLHTLAPGIIWVTALLSTVLSMPSLFQKDAEEGHLDCLLLSTHSLVSLVLSKILSHWLMYSLPCILISPLLGLLLHLSLAEEIVLILSLLLGTPTLTLWGALGAALTVHIRHANVLLPLLIMPLYIPVLIFGTHALFAGNAMLGHLAILLALACITLASAPFLIAMTLRMGVNQ